MGQIRNKVVMEKVAERMVLKTARYLNTKQEYAPVWDWLYKLKPFSWVMILGGLTIARSNIATVNMMIAVEERNIQP